MSTAQTTDPYQILGVSPQATEAEIRNAYRSAAKRTHPDANGDSSEFRRVQWAFELLSDPFGRKRFDADRQRPASTVPTPAEPFVRRSGPAPRGPSPRMAKAMGATRVWVHNRVLCTHGLAGIAADRAVPDQQELREAMSVLSEEELAELHGFAKREWQTVSEQLRTGMGQCPSPARSRLHYVPAGSRPAGSLGTRMLAFLSALVLGAAIVGSSWLAQRAYAWATPSPFGQLAILVDLVSILGIYFFPLYALVGNRPTRILTQARFAWGGKARMWAISSGALSACAGLTLLCTVPLMFTLAVTVAAGSGWLLGICADRRDDLSFPRPPSAMLRLRGARVVATQRRRAAREQRRRRRAERRAARARTRADRRRRRREDRMTAWARRIRSSADSGGERSRNG